MCPVARRLLWASLALAPLTLIVDAAVHPGDAVLFVLSAVALVPLAWLIGEATDHAAEHTGPRIGGLLNASFGNAPELIIALTTYQMRGTKPVEPTLERGWSLRRALVALGIATALTAAISEVLVHSLEEFAHAAHLSEFFISVVIVAIVGNAAEHGGAIVI